MCTFVKKQEMYISRYPQAIFAPKSLLANSNDTSSTPSIGSAPKIKGNQ